MRIALEIAGNDLAERFFLNPMERAPDKHMIRNLGKRERLLVNVGFVI